MITKVLPRQTAQNAAPQKVMICLMILIFLMIFFGLDFDESFWKNVSKSICRVKFNSQSLKFLNSLKKSVKFIRANFMYSGENHSMSKVSKYCEQQCHEGAG